MNNGDARLAFDFLESSPFPQIAYTFDLVILAANERHVALTGVGRDRLIGRPLFDVFPPNPHAPAESAEAPLRESVERVRRTGEVDSMPVVKHDLERSDAPGTFEPRFWQVVHSPLRGADGAMHGVLQTTRDVTHETGLREVEAGRRRSAEAAGKVRFWGVDLATSEIIRLPGVDRLFGFARGSRPTITDVLERVHEKDRDRVLADLTRAREAPVGTSFDSEYRIVRPDGTLRHVNSLSEVVAVENGRRLTGVLIDTTAIHHREESLRRMVEEKQALLADVNHRVKNSLQLVASLLRIEERAAAGGPLAERMRLTASRVAAVAAIHSSLYHHADVSRVNVSEHLHRFCGQLRDDYGTPLRLVVEDEPLYLSAEKAMPLALLVNELVARAITGRRDGPADQGPDVPPPVTLRLQYRGTRLLLRVENGGKRAGTVPGTLSPRLFEALLVQLGGTFTQDDDDGCNSCIELERA